MIAAKKPTVSETRVPCSTPAITLRPSSSEPSRKAPEGATIESLLSTCGSSDGKKPTVSASRTRHRDEDARGRAAGVARHARYEFVSALHGWF